MPAANAAAPASRPARWWVVGPLVVLAFAVPAAFQFAGWSGRSGDASAKKSALESARAELAKVNAELDAARAAARTELDPAIAAEQKAAEDFRAALDAARKALEDRGLAVRLTGPGRVQPGAPNKWLIEARDPRGEGVNPRKIDVVVKDSKNAELFRQTHDHPPGPVMLELPASFWERVAPGTDLFLEVSAVTVNGAKSLIAERVPLARPVYVTHLATDKPLYKPGEVVRFRSLTLDRATLLPPGHDLRLKFRLRDPMGSVVQLDEGNGRLVNELAPVNGPDGKPLRGIGVGEHLIPPPAPGGEYKLEVVEVDSSGQEVLLETRKFLVNRYTPDVFEKKLEFDGKSYGPGESVQARVEVSRTAGGPMKDAKATVVASLNGTTFHEQKNVTFNVVTDAKGTRAVLNLRFGLPADVFARKDGPPNATLSVSITDGGDAENILRPIPVATRSLTVEFFPEGGDMVEGVQGRVYFQVRNAYGKPADLKGTITDGTDSLEVSTLTDAENEGVNRGHGVFTLAPKAGRQYFLKVSSPVNTFEPTAKGFPLPMAKADGVALTALDAVTKRGEPIRVGLQVGRGPRTLHVGAYARGRLISHQKLEVQAGKPVEVALGGDDTSGGVTRVTVFEEPPADNIGRAKLIPRAERLVYRKPGEELRLNVEPDKAGYTPGGNVRLDLTATNEKNAPTPAVLMVGVVNRSVITMADNKTDRLMPTHFLLSGDVKHPAELEHADFLLTDHPKAAVALDLLLGTQGWRRFAEQTGGAANHADKGEVDRLLVVEGLRVAAPVEMVRLEEQRVASEHRPKMERATLRRAKAEASFADFQSANAGGFAMKVGAAQSAVNAADAAYTDAAAELYRYETRAGRSRSWAIVMTMLGMFSLMLGGAYVAATYPGSRRFFALGSLLALGIGIAACVAVVKTSGTDDAYDAYAKKYPPQMDEANETFSFVGSSIRPTSGSDRGAVMEAARNEPRMGGGGRMPPAMPTAMPDFDPRPKSSPPTGPLPPPGAAGVKTDPKVPDPVAVSPDALKLVADGKKAAPASDTGREKEKALLASSLRRPNRGGLGFAPGREAAGGMAPPRPAGGPMGRDMEEMRARTEDPFFTEAVPFVVREYAHRRDPALGEVRADFTETVYWHPVLVVPGSGKASVEFQLSDDVARYQVLVAGHTTDGRVGAVTKAIEARKPFTVDPKIPLEISHTDTIDVPVRVTNDTDAQRAVAFAVAAEGLKIAGKPQELFDLGPNGKARRVVRMTADKLQGDAGVVVTGTSHAADTDTIARALKIVPDGFPSVGAFSDTMEGRAAGVVKLPKDVVPGSLRVKLEVYPTSLADLVTGLDGLLREPGGCFEQTSSYNYPNTLVLDYLNQSKQANPEISARAKGFLDRGYTRLVGFECPDTPLKVKHGFEWFGGADMQHEALTAYGLLQFKDMARVHEVDPQLIKRTREFLLSKRDGKGGFNLRKDGHAFGSAPKPTVEAYIVWALVESDPDDTDKLDLAKEIAALKAQAADENGAAGKDAYFVALTANVLLQRGDRTGAHQLLDRLKDKHVKDGAVTGAVTSITRSGGRDLQIEATALSLLGWLRANDPKYMPTVKAATRWISQQRGGYGGFGSTQSTILALKALVLFAKKAAHPAESGEITVAVGGKPAGSRKFDEKDEHVIGLDIANPETMFKFGESTDVEIRTDAKQAYPFALSYTYTTLTPLSAEKCAVRVGTKLTRNDANEGDTVPMSVTLDNVTKQGHGMAVAIVGIPAGMRVPTDLKQLTDLREKGQIDFFETRGRELVLYWRGLAPEQKIALSVDLVCDVPGVYRGPASRGYLYYDADHKHWVEPLAVKIAAMEK